VIIASPGDFNEAARRKLPRFLFDARRYSHIHRAE
jgi:hypothetical protein